MGAFHFHGRFSHTFRCSLSCENFIWPTRYASNPFFVHTHRTYIFVYFYTWFMYIWGSTVLGANLKGYGTLFSLTLLIMINGSLCRPMTHRRRKKKTQHSHRIFLCLFRWLELALCVCLWRRCTMFLCDGGYVFR